MADTTYNTSPAPATARGLNSTRRYQPARYDHRDICNNATERANVRMQRERRGSNRGLVALSFGLALLAVLIAATAIGLGGK